MSSAVMLLAPERESSTLGTDFDEKVDVLWYRGAWNAKKPACGATRVYVMNRGKPDDFDIGNSLSSRDELGQLPLLAQLFGGHYLLMWTYGNSLNAAYVRGHLDGRDPLVLQVGFRLLAFGGARPAHDFREFLRWFDDGPLSPDVRRLEREYASPRISVVKWMKAFGVSGVRDLKSTDTEASWEDLRTIAGELVRGEKADSRRLRRVNAMLRQVDDSVKLPRQRGKRPGALAEKIFSASLLLRELLGKSERDYWREVTRAAAFYWDISDCPGSHRRFTVGTDEEGLGESASFGRLMMHYPARFYRDGLFWSLAAQEAEGANGHAYVPALGQFAECSHEAGFVIAIFPSDARDRFREAFGIRALEDSPPLDAQWSGEVFVDLPGVLEVDPFERVQRWFEDAGASGLCLRGEPDGSTRAGAYREGAAVDGGPQAVLGAAPDGEALQAAVRGLEFGAVCTALGLPDLLAPGAWHEGAYGGVEDASAAARAVLAGRASVLAALPAAENGRTIGDAGELFPIEDIRREHDEGTQTWVEVNQFWIVLPAVDETYQRELADDLRGNGLAGRHGDVWFEDDVVFGRITSPETSRELTLRCLWRGVLGGLPDGTQIHFRFVDIHEQSWVVSYRIDSRVANPRAARLIQDWSEHAARAGDEAVEAGEEEMDELTREVEFASRFEDGIADESILAELLLTGKDRRYYRLDLSAIERLKAPKLRSDLAQIEALSARPLGDVFCEQFHAHFLRPYFLEAFPHVWVSMMVFVLEEPIVELYTEFESPFSVTTTTNQFVQNREDRGVIFVIADSALSLEDRLAMHLREVDTLRADGHTPLDGEPSPRAFCEVVERFLRRLG